MLGGKLWSLLYGDVSVMVLIALVPGHCLRFTFENFNHTTHPVLSVISAFEMLIYINIYATTLLF